jgi:hypothetical protein
MEKIPLRENSKIPIDSDWRTKDYTDFDFFFYEGNIGYRLGPDDLVIDLDTKKLPKKINKEKFLASFCKRYHIDTFYTVRTTSGGLHVYAKKDPSQKIRTYNKKKWGEVVEFKSFGAQVVAPGSIVDGKKYKELGGDLGRLCPEQLFKFVRREESDSNSYDRPLDESDLSKILDSCPVQDFSDYEDWKLFVFACNEACNGSEEGKALVEEWSKGDKEKWDYQAQTRLDALWRGEDGITRAHLFKLYKEYTGKIFQENAKSDFKDIDQYISELEKVQEIPKVSVEVLEDQKNYREVIVENRNGAQSTVDLLYEAGVQHSKKGFVVNFANSVLAMKAIMGKYQIMYDEFQSRRPIFNPPDHLNGQINELNGKVIQSIRADLSAAGYETSQVQLSEALDALIARGFNVYHSGRDLINSLPPWDGVKRLDTWLEKLFKLDTRKDFKDKKEYIRFCSRYLIASLYAILFDESPKLDYTIILEGPQGQRKSDFCRILALKDEFFSDKSPFSDNKSEADMERIIRGKWIVEIAEMSGFNKRDMNHLKAFLTTRYSRIRPMRENYYEDLPRQNIFIGTTNDRRYLRDTTGNRRFMPIDTFHLQDFDLDNFNPAVLYSEIRDRRRAGEVFVMFPRNIEKIQAAKEQNKRRIKSELEDAVDEFMEEHTSRLEAVLKTYIDRGKPPKARNPRDAYYRDYRDAKEFSLAAIKTRLACRVSSRISLTSTAIEALLVNYGYVYTRVRRNSKRIFVFCHKDRTGRELTREDWKTIRKIQRDKELEERRKRLSRYS